jgi:hypothetical protein
LIGESKQIRISSLEYKKLCKALVGALIRFLNHSKQTKDQKDMGLELERGAKLFF